MDLSRISVLVVAPDGSSTAILRPHLRSLHVTNTHEVANTHAALRALSLATFDIVLLDDRITPVPALEFTRHVRGTLSLIGWNAPIILMASLATSADVQAARDAGINEFLLKPFAAVHLESRIRSVLENPRAFIEAGSYRGPDRRRRKLEPTTERRRTRKPLAG